MSAHARTRTHLMIEHAGALRADQRHAPVHLFQILVAQRVRGQARGQPLRSSKKLKRPVIARTDELKRKEKGGARGSHMHAGRRSAPDRQSETARGRVACVSAARPTHRDSCSTAGTRRGTHCDGDFQCRYNRKSKLGELRWET